MLFEDCENITINGKGTVDGLGYDWWIREWKNQNPAKRPNLLQITRSRFGEISGVNWINSPRFHIMITDVDSFYLHDFEIAVDIVK